MKLLLMWVSEDGAAGVMSIYQGGRGGAEEPV